VGTSFYLVAAMGAKCSELTQSFAIDIQLAADCVKTAPRLLVTVLGFEQGTISKTEFENVSRHLHGICQ
jgi:hypothetical protein